MNLPNGFIRSSDYIALDICRCYELLGSSCLVANFRNGINSGKTMPIDMHYLLPCNSNIAMNTRFISCAPRTRNCSCIDLHAHAQKVSTLNLMSRIKPFSISHSDCICTIVRFQFGFVGERINPHPTYTPHHRTYKHT